MLLSKDAIKNAGMKLDLINDKAEIFGQSVSLENKASGHYCVPLREVAMPIVNSLLSNSFENDKAMKLLKLHKQFTHPPSTCLIALLKDAGIYDNECKGILTKLDETCDTCLSMKRKPPRPIVSSPIATEYSEVVVLHLKEWEKGKKWILHMIDTATRFTLSAFVTDKKPATIRQNYGGVDRVRFWLSKKVHGR